MGQQKFCQLGVVALLWQHAPQVVADPVRLLIPGQLSSSHPLCLAVHTRLLARSLLDLLTVPFQSCIHLQLAVCILAEYQSLTCPLVAYALASSCSHPCTHAFICAFTPETFSGAHLCLTLVSLQARLMQSRAPHQRSFHLLIAEA